MTTTTTTASALSAPLGITPVRTFTRTNYSAAHKAHAVAQVLEGGKSIASTARELGINNGTLTSWVCMARHPRPVVCATDTTAIRKELSGLADRLASKLARLDREREALNSALAGIAAALAH